MACNGFLKGLVASSSRLPASTAIARAPLRLNPFPYRRAFGTARSLPLSTLARPTPSTSQRPAAAPRPVFLHLCRRHFHPSRIRHDVFFLSVPAIKSGLLNITRISLLFLPFVFRYRLWKRYRRASYLLIQIPIFALCIIFALGLDQSPRTGRWRLLLMSESEEMAWSRRKHREVLQNDGCLLLPPDDPRSQNVARVCSRLVTALEEQDHHVVSGASWPPRSGELSRVISEREAAMNSGSRNPGTDVTRLMPSGVAHSAFMPFRPDSSNPLKTLESADWNLYVVDSPQLNAFALPSKDIFVYTGLLNLLPDDDAMLAAVLGHEIAHVAERHSVENMGFLNVAAVAFDVLRGLTFALTISFPFLTDSAGLFINWINDVVAERAYSRKLEKEADAVGLEIMATAGYDPRAAFDLWELMSCVEADAVRLGQAITVENKFAILRTHPTSDERHRALEKDMPSAMRIWKERWPKKAQRAEPDTTQLSAKKDPAPPAARDDAPGSASSSHVDTAEGALRLV